MVYAWNLYPLYGTTLVRSFSKKGELFLFPRELSLKQLLILLLNKDDKKRTTGYFKTCFFTMNKFDVLV